MNLDWNQVCIQEAKMAAEESTASPYTSDSSFSLDDALDNAPHNVSSSNNALQNTSFSSTDMSTDDV